ncbi:hypothetical protein D4764_01G0020290 [Takifugu flavidus]|uniref:Uncharacterized protein n=1 Tax=Takifugu flavidus TaxID=433684 RepID=A0A5C6PRB3_9TELE|nr:hypothetical protein D4764_01G0020290 [Takifugu flavidus]
MDLGDRAELQNLDQSRVKYGETGLSHPVLKLDAQQWSRVLLPPCTPTKVPPSTYHSSAISSSTAERHQSPPLIQYTHGDDNELWGTELQAIEINGATIKTITHIRRVCFD